MQVLSWPAVYALELTPACNNRCTGCSNVYQDVRTHRPASAEIWEGWLAQFGPEAARFHLTGGEPTLHPEFLRIVRAALSYEAHVTVFTNARWHRPDQLLTALRGAANLMGFLVSLHGPTAESHEAFSGQPGSFDEAVTNIRRAVGAGFTVALCAVLNRHNLGEIHELVALGKQLGVEHIAFNRYLGPRLAELEPTQGALRAAIRDIEQLSRTGESVRFGNGIPQCFARNGSEGCLAGAAYVAIDPWGAVHPCPRSRTVLGSLETQTLFDVWHGDKMAAWRSLLDTRCGACAAYQRCHGGCRVMQEYRNARDPQCTQPLARYRPPTAPCEVPGAARPTASLRARPESFGYTLLGRGNAVPVSAAGLEVIQACDGKATFAELAARYGWPGLDLLGMLLHLNMLDIS
jgi:radical SAM protein with 4Fe4S-binding SPASM domain